MDILHRKPIWIALSNLYLDTELQEYDFHFIASTIKQSPYTLENVKRINKEEVFPVLYANLLSVAGVWSGFQEVWLVEEIFKKQNRKTWLGDFMMKLKYAKLKWMFEDDWKKLEEAYEEQ